MDLFDVARACLRRWYVLLPLLLITGWVSHAAYTSVQPVYYSNAVIGLTPPSTRVDNSIPGVPVPRNGLLDIGGASLVANMTAIGLREPSVVERVVAAGGRPDYNSRMFPGPESMPQLPLIMIEETAPDPAAATKTLELVIEQAEVTLRTLQQQAQVQQGQMVTPFVVSPPSEPLGAAPSRTRSTAVKLIAGLGLAILLSVVVDILMTRRKARTRRRRQAAEVVKEANPTPLSSDIHQMTDAVPASEDAMDVR